MQHLHRLHMAMAALSSLAFVFSLLVLSHLANRIDTLNGTELTVAHQPDTLRVITRDSPATYYATTTGSNADEANASGFEHALLQAFAEHIGKKLEIETASTLAEIYSALEEQRVHIAAPGLPIERQRQARFTVTKPYAKHQQEVVYRVGNKRPRQVSDLAGRDIVVVADSSQASQLAALQGDNPGIQWREVSKSDYIDLLHPIESGEADYAIIGVNEFRLHRGFFPRVKEGFRLGEPESIAWALPAAFANTPLHNAANQFLQTIATDGRLAKLEERFFGHSEHVSQMAANEFDKNYERHLPRHRQMIGEVAEKFDMEWQLLAAISYQESGWNERAKSPTGVRGLMMLTLPTAREVGVTNRLDPAQSLHGGALYLQRIKSRLADDIQEPDRSWLALAAYNVGMGHLQDARTLTRRRGGDPNAWYDIKQDLPLLSKPEWYRTTRYGYARGHEPVTYVQNIRHYFNVLQLKDRYRQRSVGEYEAPISISTANEQSTPLETTTLANTEALEPALGAVRSL